MKKEPGFESALEELEKILEKMADEGTTLEEGIALYARAAQLMQESGEMLEKAQLQIDEIDEAMQKLRDDDVE